MSSELEVDRESSLHEVQHLLEQMSLLDEVSLDENTSYGPHESRSDMDWDDDDNVHVVYSENDVIRVSWTQIEEYDLDFSHQIRYVIPVPGIEVWAHVRPSLDDLMVNCAVGGLFSLYHMWQASDLRQLAAAHGVHVNVRDTTPDMIQKLDGHLCGRGCPAVVVAFQTLRRPRPRDRVARVRDEFSRLDLLSTHSYMRIADEELRRSIIREWQEAISTQKLSTAVCAACGRRCSCDSIVQVPLREIDLQLLVNDGLPAKVLPDTYAFDLYERALLNPAGMIDRWEHADLLLCKTCNCELVVNGRMPRLCLANWLYYAHDRLPPVVKKAFDESTQVDRFLVSRARASRISFKFTELRKKATEDFDEGVTFDEPDSERRRGDVSQQCVRGNVLIMPQNSTHLNSVLPPPPEVIRDSVCVVYVGNSTPTKKTIGRFGPALARKSRVRTMINFLVGDNVHYARDTTFHGFEPRNLDLLFDGADANEDEAMPCAIDVGFIDDSEVVRAAVSDYTSRNDDEDEPEEDRPLLMENVGYTLGDDSGRSYDNMKMKALSHCLNGGRFVRSRGGDRFLPDFENPSLLTWLFPHLDPWGIGGFHEEQRSTPVTMDEQLKYLLELDDSPFMRDSDFAFVYYNILQKKAVCDSVHFRVSAARQRTIVNELMSIDKMHLDKLISKFKRDPRYEPQTDEEKGILTLINRVGASLQDIPGTSGYKLKMRNEIRSLVSMRGTPALFITLNPSDINHPLVRLFSGDNICLEALEAGQELTAWQRKELVADNPGPCAKFFHTIISTFITTVLRFGRKERGLLGKCTGYYGTVEAQGRGTLHCHMLIWLYGHPSPCRMREMMLDSAAYEQDLFRWLESIIKCELLGTTQIVTERPGEEMLRPKFPRGSGYQHPGTVLGPSIDVVPESSYPLQFGSSVNDVVQEFNWHNHTDTCWKYLKSGEKKNDESCRMRIDGSTRETTVTDPESGSILLRRLHPRIANYNDVVIFLLRANMDIKHIGPGDDAKALIFYITDYITKSGLPAHVGLAALLYAINRSGEKYRGVQEWGKDQDHGTLTILVNSMLSKQEISHQQVMSYLVGGGDRYASDSYRVLHFPTFERHVLRCWASESDVEDPLPTVNSSGSENLPEIQSSIYRSPVETEVECPHHESGTDGDALHDGARSGIDDYYIADDQVTLRLGPGTITAINQIQDYTLRPANEPFASMGLFEFVGMTEKITKDQDGRRASRRRSESQSTHHGRPEQPRGEFAPEHLQHDTHLLRKRTVWVIPVVLGHRNARPDRSDEERDIWAQTILTLFMPWRSPRDLKESDELWSDAYDRQKNCIPPEHMAIIRNMNVLAECREARDKASAARAAARHPQVYVQARSSSPDPFAVFENFAEGPQSSTNAQSSVESSVSSERTLPLLESLDKGLGIRFRHALDECYKARISHHESSSFGVASVPTEDQVAELQAEQNIMRQVKKKRRIDVPEHNQEDFIRNVRPRTERHPRLDVAELSDTGSASASLPSSFNPDQQSDMIRQVVLEKNLLSNPEQLRAFQIVAQHVCFGGEQLLMYIGGVGGTGKSHVVNSILRLFTLLGKDKNILVAAPTGAAAILIGGYTIHSLTLLPDTPGRNLQELCNIWDKVDYLILDETSMIGASFLSLLNGRLQRAKGTDESTHDSPFGGINIIFTGDFGQLRPVRESPLYSHKLVTNPGLEQCKDKRGVSALMGVYLWRLVKTVMLLKRNQRQAADKPYGELLSRVRTGTCVQRPQPGHQSDYAVLETRYLDRIAINTPAELAKFVDAPVIVGRKRIRDLLNLRLLEHHATSIRGSIQLYHSRDRIRGRPVTNAEQEALWQIPSSASQDSLGRLPLFPGMKVMVQENLAFSNRVVNGSEGTVRDIIYEEVGGFRYPLVVYVHIPGSGRVHSSANNDIVPIFPETSTFTWDQRTSTGIERITVSRTQVPLLPAYAYTDYKLQGRSLDVAIVDPQSASTLQGVYVMLSRLRTINGLAILRKFSDKRIFQRLSQELRDELSRLDDLDRVTANRQLVDSRHVI